MNKYTREQLEGMNSTELTTIAIEESMPELLGKIVRTGDWIKSVADACIAEIEKRGLGQRWTQALMAGEPHGLSPVESNAWRTKQYRDNEAVIGAAILAVQEQ